MTDMYTIRLHPHAWVIRAGGAVLGETQNALEVTKGDNSVLFFPQADIAMAMLEAGEATTTMEGFGTATYFSIPTKSTVIEDAAWAFDAPVEGMERLAGYITFHPDKVTVEEL